MAAADKEKNGGKKPGTPDTGAAAQHIYFLITTQWIHVAILTMLGAGCLVVLFGQAVVIVALEGARDGLIRFMRS